MRKMTKPTKTVDTLTEISFATNLAKETTLKDTGFSRLVSLMLQ